MIPDKFGHCAMCHKNLINERISDMKVIQMFTPEHAETEVLLNDGSRMRVCICKSCKENVDLTKPAIQRMIMNCVKEGWKLEIHGLADDPKRPDWTQERANNHMELYNKKEIYCISDGLSDHVIEEHKRRLQAILQEDQDVAHK